MDNRLIRRRVDANFIREQRYAHLLVRRRLTLPAFHGAIRTERRAVELAFHLGLIPTTLRCPSCNGLMTRSNHNRHRLGWRWRCRVAHDDRGDVEISPLQNTFFERHLLSFKKTFEVNYYFFLKMEVTFAAHHLNISKRTVIDYYSFMREVMDQAEAHDSEPIGGVNDVVEIDEAHLFTRKYHRGRYLRRAMWVFGIISRLTRRVYVEPLNGRRRDRDTLDAIMREHMRMGSYVMSDYWRPYIGLDRRLYMSGHFRVNHSLNFVEGTVDIPVDPELGREIWYDPDNVRVQVHTNTIERQWLEMKRLLRTCRSAPRVRLYVSEYLYRHNILRDIPRSGEQFVRLLTDVGRVYPGPRTEGIRANGCRCADNNCQRRA